MDLTLFFAILGGLLVLACVANRLVRFTRVPDIVILMATGVLIGPVLHWVKPDVFRGATHGLGTLALILILFEGGLELKLREILRHFGSGFFLSLFSYLLCMCVLRIRAGGSRIRICLNGCALILSALTISPLASTASPVSPVLGKRRVCRAVTPTATLIT
jgi:NhaP-type Na+/H+ or K+/H+ antiporter